MQYQVVSYFCSYDQTRDRITCANVIFPDAIGNSTYSNGTDSRGCHRYSDNGANATLLTWGNSESAVKGLNNETEYDRAVTKITPILTTVWEKPGVSGLNVEPNWLDARLLCMKTDMIEKGSRTPVDVPSSGVRVTAGILFKCLLVTAVMAVGSMLC